MLPQEVAAMMMMMILKFGEDGKRESSEITRFDLLPVEGRHHKHLDIISPQ